MSASRRIPFFLDKVDAGQIRIIGTGNDVASLRSRTGRVNLTNVATLQNRKDVMVRFHRGLQGNGRLDVFRSGRAEAFRRIPSLPEKVVARVRELLPKETHEPRPGGRHGSDHRRSAGAEVHHGAADAGADQAS